MHREQTFGVCRHVGALLVVITIVMAASAASAQEASLSAVDEPEMGVATLVGPRVGMNGPPTAFAVQAHFWHVLYERIAFHAIAGATASGETTLESEYRDTDDATYDSTFGGTFAVGVRYLLDLGHVPFDTWVRADLAVDITGGSELIGYTMGPVAGTGLAYTIDQGLDLVAELELGLGLGQYRAEGIELSATLNALVGAQLRF